MGQLLTARENYNHLSENECWQQWGYYGIALNERDESPVVLPEVLLCDSLIYVDNLDHSRLFSLIIDWLYFYSDLLRPEVFAKIGPSMDERELRILCGILSLQDKRRFAPLVEKLSETLDTKSMILGSQGRINSFGEDPVMARFGIICTTIDKTRSDKKIMPRDELVKYCSFMKARVIIGPNARSDFFSFRAAYPEKKIAKIRELTFASKTSSVYFERNFKYFNLQ